MTENLSPAAKSALINAKASRQGAQVSCGTFTYGELKDAGLVGADFGLTRKGVTARQQLVSAALDAAF